MEDAQTKPDPGSRTVAELAADCITVFERLLHCEMDRDILENAQADFRLWVHGVGALARSGLSLDSRLKGRPDDLGLVRSTLDILSSFLNELASSNAGGNQNNDEDSLSRHEIMWGIDSSLKSLSLIGAAIRQTGKASRSRRTDMNFNSADHSDFRKHLECIVLLRPSKHGHDTRDLDSSKLNDLQTRLIEANLRRRHRFLMAQEHSLRLEGTPSIHQEAMDGIETIQTPQTPVTHAKPHLATAKEKPRGHSAAPPSTALQSRASTAKGPLQYVPAKPTHEIARTQITAIAADAELPRQPGRSLGRQLFQCPCCCQSIPTTENWK